MRPWQQRRATYLISAGRTVDYVREFGEFPPPAAGAYNPAQNVTGHQNVTVPKGVTVRIAFRTSFSFPKLFGPLNPLGVRVATSVKVEVFTKRACNTLTSRWEAREIETPYKHLFHVLGESPSAEGMRNIVQNAFDKQDAPWRIYDQHGAELQPEEVDVNPYGVVARKPLTHIATEEAPGKKPKAACGQYVGTGTVVTKKPTCAACRAAFEQENSNARNA